MRKKDFFLGCLKFILPSVLWLFLFKTFLLREATIFSENFSQYSSVKFYLDNLRLGVYPLWNPFLLWGVPDMITLVNIGPFNPLWLLTFLLDAIGLDFYGAYLTTIIIYFFIGQIGFYLLAKTLLRDTVAAYAVFVMLIFSSISMSMFAQYILILIWVPSVWFFYFFISLIQTWRKRFFVGTIFSLMLILSTYLPFYFLTVLLAVVLLFLFFCGGNLKEIVSGGRGFLRKNILLFLICLGVMGMSLSPTIQMYRATLAQEIVVPFRQIEKNAVLHQGVTLASYAKTTDGAISARMFFDDLFSNLGQIEYGNDGFVYVSLFAFLVLGMSIFNGLTKRAVMLFFLSLFLFLLSITNATPLHPFLFKHVFYFKFFRNLHYLMPFLLTAFLLFVGEQLRLLLEGVSKPLDSFPLAPPSAGLVGSPSAGEAGRGIFAWRSRWLSISLTVVVHLTAWIFLMTRENVVGASYITIVGSFLFFLFYFAGCLENRKAFIFLFLLVIISLQPAQVFCGYNAQAKNYTSAIISKSIQISSALPQFSFLRPDFDQKRADMRLSTDPQNYFNSHRISMTDSPGFFMPYEYGFPTFWSYYFSKHIPDDVSRQYTRYKFFVYDRIRLVDEEYFDLNILANALRRNLNLAFVSSPIKEKVRDELSSFLERDKADDKSQARLISHSESELAVKHLDVNSLRIETDFKDEKFLVYTDSFDRYWQAFINGRETAIYRTNLAFKGIKLPAGYNEVYFRYAPPGGTAIHFFILTMFVGMLMYLLWLFWRDHFCVIASPAFGGTRNDATVKFFSSIFQRCFILYLCAGVILSLFVDSSIARLNRLNHLKQVEHSVKSFELGLIPFNAEEFRWAARYYRELLKFFPPSDLVYGNLGFCYYYLGDYERAIRAYQQAIALESHLYLYYLDMGLILFQVGEVKNAASLFDTSLNLLPATVAFYETLAEKLPAKNKNMMTLVGLLKKRAEEDAMRIYYYLGLTNFLDGNYPLAAGHFNKAIILNPKDISAYYYRGLTMEKLGNKQQQSHDFQRVSFLKSQGVEEREYRTENLRLHLNTELVVLRYLSDKRSSY